MRIPKESLTGYLGDDAYSLEGRIAGQTQEKLDAFAEAHLKGSGRSLRDYLLLEHHLAGAGMIDLAGRLRISPTTMLKVFRLYNLPTIGNRMVYEQDPEFGLSQSEISIFALVCMGDSDKAISLKMEMEPPAVANALSRCYGKFGISQQDGFSLRVKAAVMYREKYQFQYCSRKKKRVLLTQLEQSALGFLAQGYSNGKIGEELSMSESSAKECVHKIYSSIGVSGVYDMVNKRVMAMLMYDRLLVRVMQ